MSIGDWIIRVWHSGKRPGLRVLIWWVNLYIWVKLLLMNCVQVREETISCGIQRKGSQCLKWTERGRKWRRYDQWGQEKNQGKWHLRKKEERIQEGWPSRWEPQLSSHDVWGAAQPLTEPGSRLCVPSTASFHRESIQGLGMLVSLFEAPWLIHGNSVTGNQNL